MPKLRIEWSPDIASPDPRPSTAEVAVSPELDAQLEAIAHDAQQPLIVELISPAGARLGIGLGIESNSVLAFNASDDPPYYLSSGGIGSPQDEVVFSVHGHWTEFPASALIPQSVAREAARRFLVTGARPDNVDWEQV